MKKTLLTVGGGVLVLGVALVVVWLLRFRGQPLPTSVQDITCTTAVSVQGRSMEPAIKAGTRLLFDTCADKQSIVAGTIVLFAQGNVTIVGRVKERTDSQGTVTYKIAQDARPGQEFTIPADGVIATGK